VVQEGEIRRVPHITEAEMRDTGKLLDLFGRLVAEGLFLGSEADRLDFVSAAEHAVRKATKNACGFFAHMLRNWDRCKRFATEHDIDTAHRRLKAFDYGENRNDQP
jgi:hypothetical protein